MSDSDSLGDRMKGYELAYRSVMPRRMPVILRLDGRAFHTYTRGAAKPFSTRLMDAMDTAAAEVCKEAQGATISYVQSDEISILLHNYRSLVTCPWFDNQVQKIVSVSASIAAVSMTLSSQHIFGHTKPASFDARVFVLPEAEVCNYFIWRQQDAIRNSISMLAQSLYGHSELIGKSCSEMQTMMLTEKNINWNGLPTAQRRGRCVYRKVDDDGRSDWVVDQAPPIFTQDRQYIEMHLSTESNQ